MKMKHFSILLTLLFSAALPLGAAITLGGSPLTRIVLAADAAPSAKCAAQELQKYLEKTTGDRLEIMADAAESGNIFVGEKAELVADLPSEGYRLLARDGNLYITGRDQREIVIGIRNPWNLNEVYNTDLGVGAFGETGTLYGVYHFLENYAGIRFYWPGELGTVITPGDIELPAAFDETNHPKFSYRYTWLCNFQPSPDNALWFRQAGFGSCAPVQIIDFNFFFTEAFKENHPEYLALVDGERDSGNKCAIRGGGHLCYNAPGVVEAVADLIKNYFREHPEHKYFPLVPGDGLVRCCECPACQAEIEPEKGDSGKYSYHVWNFVNKVAGLVADEFPDRYVGCLAYESYLNPPERIGKFNSNVAVMFCANRGAMASPAYYAAMRERIAGWRKLNDNPIFLWNYYLQTWLPWRALPVVFPHTIQKDLREMRALNFGGEFIEAESWGTHGGPTEPRINFPATQHMNLYVTAKLYWDPDLDLDALLEEYYRLFYGPAAEPMKRFFTHAEACWIKANNKSQSTSGIFESITPRDAFAIEDIRILDQCLDEAIAAVPAGSAYAGRIAQMQEEYGQGRRSIIVMARENKPEMTALACQDAIRVDGLLDEATWKEGKGEPMVTRMGENTPYRTVVYSRHDNDNLYFGFVLHEEKMNKLHIEGNTRDYPELYLDDCVEIYLMPEDRDGYQFIVNAAGVLWDALRFDNGSIDAKWNCEGAQAAVQIDGKRITIEVALPLAPLGLKGGDSVRANFYRSRVVDENQQFAAWSPTFSEGHFNPPQFGRLTLE